MSGEIHIERKYVRTALGSASFVALALSLGAAPTAQAQQITRGGGGATGGIAGGGGGNGGSGMGTGAGRGGTGGSGATEPDGSAQDGAAGTNSATGGAGGGAGTPNDIAAGGGGGGGGGETGNVRGGMGGDGAGGGNIDSRTGSVALGADYSGSSGSDGAGGLGGSGGGGGGSAGLVMVGTAVNLTTDRYAVTGGSGGSSNAGGGIAGSGGGGGAGLVLLHGGAVAVTGGAGGASGVISGGMGGAAGNLGGAGGAGLFLYAGGGLANQSGAIRGGNGGGSGNGLSVNQGGQGGAGVLSNMGTIENEATITGGVGGNANQGGGNGGIGVEAWGGTVENGAAGKISGGIGGRPRLSGSFFWAGNGGSGVRFKDGQTASLINAGTIEGGAGGIAPFNDTRLGRGGVAIVGAATGNISIINSGTIAGGVGSRGSARSEAILLFGSGNRLELRSGSIISGDVVVSGGTGNTLALGGAADAVLNVSQIGALQQYRGFNAFEKTGSSTWTLTGAGDHTWSIASGVLIGNTDSLAGSVIFDSGVGNRDLTFDQAFDGSYNSTITGDGSVTKIGSGVLTLTGANSYTGDTVINEGTLRVAADINLGAVEGGLSFNGSSLHTTASFASRRAIDLVGIAAFLTDAGTTLTLDGLVSGAGGLVKVGAGNLVLTGDSNYGGGTTVSGGTLLVNGDQSAATGLTFVAANATLGGTGTIGGDVRLGNGTLAPGAGGAGTLTINGELSMAAGSRLAVDFGAANAVGSPLNDVVNVGGDLVLDGTLNVAVTPGGAFDIGLYRVLNYGGTLTDNGLAIGTMPAGADVSVQTSVAWRVNLINTGGATLNFWDGAAGPKFNGLVNGGIGVWQNGSGNDNWADATGAVNAGYDDGAFAIFTGTAGTITIDNSLGAVTASSLQFATDGYTITGDALTLIGPQSVIRVGDGSAGGAGYTATIASQLTGTTQLVKTDQGTLALTGINSYTGGTAINGGTVRISSDGNLGAASGGLSLNGGALNTTGSLSSARAVELAGSGMFLTDAGTTLTLGGAVTGASSLTKSGGGTLVLKGSGTYAGGTNVGAGTLLVNGDYAGATGATTVGSGANLGGTGTIGGNVALANGATLMPGAGGAGTLTINGNLSLAEDSALVYEFGQANVAGGALNDLVNVGGDLVLDGKINVSVPTGGVFDFGVYRVFNYAGALTNSGLTLGTLPAGSNVAVQTSIAGQVNLVNSAGLSLAFWDGGAGPKNNGVINGGSGTWQSSTGNDNWADASGAVNAAYSDGAFAVFGGTGGTVTVHNSLGQVSAGGMQFAANGYTLTGDSIALTGSQSTIRVGDGSTAGAGFTAMVNAVLSGDTQLVKTDAGTLVLAGLNTFTGGTRMTGGTLEISADANLGAANGDVTLDGGTLATSANLTSARDIVMAGAGTIATAAGTTFTFNGVLSGSGALSKTGAGTLVLTGDSSGYAGSTQVTGTLRVNGSLCGDVNVLAGGRVGGNGAICTTVNAGTIAPGNSIGTLTVAGSYTGNNGILEIETVLGGDASPTDRLVVTGGTSGTTQVNVVNQGGLGAQTVEGIKIVDVTGGTSAGTFTLNGDYDFHGSPAVIAGAYGYRLFQGGVSTPADGDWYLRSALLVAPNEPQVPLYQPGVPIYEAYNQTLLALTDLGTLQQRIGNRQWAQADSGQPSGIWGRMQSNRSRPNAAFSTSMSEVNVDSWKLELGADHVLSERGDGATLVLGVLGGYGEANASIGSIYGSGSIKAKSYSAGATLTWFGPDGFYVDGRAQAFWFDSKLKSAVLGTLADGNDGTGQAYSLEVGKRARIGQTLGITPQIQMVYSTMRFDRFTDPNDAMVSSRLGDSLKTRWGVALDRQDATSHLYGVVNLSYEWLDGTVTDVSGTSIARENDRLWGEIGVGGSLLLGDRVTLYTEASADTAINDFGSSYSLKATAGLRLAF
jgi:fibronectin-binding autotransporter adhesin